MPNGNDEFAQYKRGAGGAATADEFAEFKRPGPTPATTKLEKQAAFDSSTPAKLGRGALLGAAEGAGIVPTTETSLTGGVEAQTAKQFGKGALRLIEDVGAPFVDPFLPEEKRMHPKYPALGPLGSDIASGLVEGGSEAWKGLKERDPEAFAHGLGSTIAQILMLKSGGKEPPVEAIGERARMAKTTRALELGGKGEEFHELQTAMPEIVNQAQQAGINTVGEFGKQVKKSRKAMDDEFNIGMQPFRYQDTVPAAIARKIRNLMTPDMVKTAEGQAQAAHIENRALEYDKPWTYNELNSKRVTENKNLSAFYNKGMLGQMASPLDTSISKAIRDGAADIVYDKWDKTNKGGRAATLKRSQGALMNLDDYLNDKGGYIDKLESRQADFEGQGFMDKINVRAAAHRGGIGAYITGPLLAPFEKGPREAASAKIAEAFPGRSKSPFKRVKAASLPISVLVGRQTPFDSQTPEPPAPPEDNE